MTRGITLCPVPPLQALIRGLSGTASGRDAPGCLSVRLHDTITVVI
eukprot:COSAG06_NODE_59670_length_273_cov_0.890805_1_plen_45_part_01